MLSFKKGGTKMGGKEVKGIKLAVLYSCPFPYFSIPIRANSISAAWNTCSDILTTTWTKMTTDSVLQFIPIRAKRPNIACLDDSRRLLCAQNVNSIR